MTMPLRDTRVPDWTLFGLGLLLASCTFDLTTPSPEDPPAAAVVEPVAARRAPAYGGGLVSPELFDLAAQWSRESLAPKRASLVVAGDLASYARAHAPAVADEAVRIMGASSGTPPIGRTEAAGCACRVVGTFFGVDANTSSQSTWTATNKGAAHTAHIYDVQSGSSSEVSADLAVATTQFQTQLLCTTPEGWACAAGCTAQLYADVQYSSKAYAEAHTWTIWNKAGTTQVSDGAALTLRKPYAEPVRLFEKEVSAHQSATHTAFDPENLANTIKAALGITVAILTDEVELIPALAGNGVKSAMGIIQHLGGTNGSITQSVNARYQTLFDTVPPPEIAYSTQSMQVYALDLSSKINMRVHGWGYHSKTGDLKSSYSMAVYISNFTCDGSVTAIPPSAGFWHYDGYGDAPLSTASLRSNISSFFLVATGRSVPVTTNHGEIYVGVCGDQVCDSFENPSSCAGDCGTCGDNTCNSRFENAFTCIEDCNWCGDGRCYGAEDAYSCVQDCGYCGDGTCYNEDAASCPSDCPSVCGDGFCASDEFWACPWDCPSCGDDICSPGEDFVSCSIDCPF